MTAVFRALADDNRRDVLELLSDGELSAGAVADHFDLTRQAVSHHLRQLHEAGLVNERRDGTRRLYSVRLEGLAVVVRYVDRFWGARLEQLRDLVEDEVR